MRRGRSRRAAAAEAAAAEPPPPEPPFAAVAVRPLPEPPLDERSLSKHACIACELRGGRPRQVAADLEGLAAGLQLRDDLRDDTFLVLGEQGQPLRHLRDTVDRRDLRGGGLLERQLRARQEEVVDEMRAGLAELREVGDHRLVRLQQVAVAAAAAGPAEAAALILLRLQRHGQVGADAGERVQRLLLRIVEPVREARDRDTSATPRPSPSSVRIVRVRRRTSSLRR